jgi:hypothetical protein
MEREFGDRALADYAELPKLTIPETEGASQ